MISPAPTPSPTPAPSPTPTPTPTATGGLLPLGTYVVSPTLDGGQPLVAGFDINLGLTATSGTPAPYDVDRGAFRFVCGGEGKLAKVDPIVFPGVANKSHIHQAWGNSDFSSTTTVDTIRQNAVTDCNNTPYSLNRSSYWMPALVNDQDQAIEPDLVVVYYKQWSNDSQYCTPGSATFVGKCINIPNQLRFVFGWNAYNPTAKVEGASWYCTGGDGKHYSNLDDVFTSGCRAGDTVIANTMAPHCWDGKYLDTPDHRSHVAYGFYQPSGIYTCPAGYSYTIPQEENKVMWTVTADMYAIQPDGSVRSRIKLESDHMLPGGKPGETLHADYMEGWVSAAKKLWFDNCIQKKLSCNGGELGNGFQLIGAAQPTYGWVNPNPRVSLTSIN